MLVNCPKCETHFKVPDKMISEGGRKVRCIKCEHIWQQMRNGDQLVIEPEPEAPTADKKAKGKDTPAKKEASKKSSDSNSNKKNTKIEPQQDRDVESADEMAGDDNVKKKKEKKPKKQRKIRSGTAINRQQILIIFLLILVTSMFSILSNHKHLQNFSHFYNSVGLQNTDNLVFSKFEVKKIFEDGKVKFLVDGEITNESAHDLTLPDLRLLSLTVGGRVMHEEIIPTPHRTLRAGETIPYKHDITATSQTDTVVLDIGNAWELPLR